MIVTGIKTVAVEIDEIEDGTEICRDESCPIIEIHAAHRVVPSMRGRAPKSCPHCFRPIPRGQGPRCLVCGWDRRNSVFTKKGQSNA
jgi:hypothetical protein